MDEITLINILNNLSRFNARLSWRLRCAFSDGKGQSILELKISENNKTITKGAKIKGQITFDLESGIVRKALYSGVPRLTRPTHITDRLLDILFVEKTNSLATVN